MGLTQWRRLEVICLYLITFVFKYLSFHLCNWLLKLKKEVLVSQLEELTSAQCKRPSLLGAFSGATISTSVSTVDCENPTVACNSPTSPTNLLHGGLDSDFSAGAGAGAGVEMRPGENGSSDCTGTSVHASARSFGVKCASSKARTKLVYLEKRLNICQIYLSCLLLDPAAAGPNSSNISPEQPEGVEVEQSLVDKEPAYVEVFSDYVDKYWSYFVAVSLLFFVSNLINITILKEKLDF